MFDVSFAGLSIGFLLFFDFWPVIGGFDGRWLFVGMDRMPNFEVIPSCKLGGIASKPDVTVGAVESGVEGEGRTVGVEVEHTGSVSVGWASGVLVVMLLCDPLFPELKFVRCQRLRAVENFLKQRGVG